MWDKVKLFGNKLLLSRASLYGLLGESKTVCSLRANCSPQLRQGLPECPTQCPGIRRFSNLSGWEQVFCRPCGSAQHCYSLSLWGHFPQHQLVASHALFSILLNTVEKPFVNVEHSLSVQSSLLWSSVLRTLASLLSPYYQLHLLNSGSLSPLPVIWPGSSN